MNQAQIEMIPRLVQIADALTSAIPGLSDENLWGSWEKVQGHPIIDFGSTDYREANLRYIEALNLEVSRRFGGVSERTDVRLK